MRRGNMIAPWLPYEPIRVYTERSAQALIDAYMQFDVEANIRYKPWVGSHQDDTYCNIFMWDCLRALGIDNPSHWVDRDGKAATPMSRGALEETANRHFDWFRDKGAAYGWSRVDVLDAQRRVEVGHPVVLVWKNSAGRGHVAMLLPGGDVIQAGRVNGVVPLHRAFGDKLFTRWTHD